MTGRHEYNGEAKTSIHEREWLEVKHVTHGAGTSQLLYDSLPISSE
jgi:hypothetical protein